MDDLEQVVRQEWGRLVALFVAQFRRLDLVEDALGDAVESAARTWPADGRPANPPAWLMTAARRRILDRLRTEEVARRKQPLLLTDAERHQEGSRAMADSGSLVYNGGWHFDAPDAVAAGQGARLNFSTDPDWFYSFVSSVDGMFEMDYAIIGIGDTAGLRGWQFAWNNGSRTLGGDALDPTESGDVRFSVLRGGTYRVSLTNLAQIETLGNLAGVRGQMDGNFNWRIVENAVPEPASWTLMILGFGLTGASLRQTSSRKSVRIG